MIIGIDLGGTTTKIGIVDEGGKVLTTAVVNTQKYTNFKAYVDALYEATTPMIERFGGFSKIEGIGVGCPNGNHYTGNIENAVNLPWKGIIPFAKTITEKFSLPCKITNDANAAALGEKIYGCAKDKNNFIMITLGTGVGSGIVVDGKLLYGHDGFAGELGHVNTVRDGRLCGCGKKGCLEAYCSATGVVRTAVEYLANSNEASILRKKKISEITSKDVFLAAQKEDKIAQKIFAVTGEMLGRAFADFVAFSSPEAIVLFGGLARAGKILFDPIEKAMNENLLPIWKEKIKILPSALPENDAAILGAAALIKA